MGGSQKPKPYKIPIPKFLVRRLKFVRRGSNFSAQSRRWQFFFGNQVAKMRVLGWLDAFRAVKLALQHSCEKASLRL